MFAFRHSGRSAGEVPTSRLAASLSLYRPDGADETRLAAGDLLTLDHPDLHVSRDHESGLRTVLLGWLDDVEDVAEALGISASGNSMADLFGHAFRKFGPATDHRLSGNFCALVVEKDGTVRLSRSAWNAPPLYFARSGEGYVVSPHVRVLQEAGAAQVPDPARLRDALAFDFHEDDETTLYPGIERVRLGSAIRLRPQGKSSEWRYDPAEVAVRDEIGDEEAVERALELLDKSLRYVAKACTRPVVSLSSGLDSSIVAARLAQVLAPDPLRTVTLRPHPKWRAGAGRGSIHDEWPRVERFAAGHPGIEADWIDSQEAGFDTLAREVFRASRLFNPAIANVGTFAPLWAKAKALGGDCIIDAELGNQSFSARGDWGLREDLRALRLPQLARNLTGTRPGHLSALHHGYHHLLAPYVPQPLKAAARRLMGREEAIARVSALRSAHFQAHGADRSGNASAWRQGWGPMSRGEIARLDHSVCDRGGADVALAMQEIHGVRARDAAAYRPLIEFCLSLPTEQFLRDGTDRCLARRMALGIMPEDQRCEPSMAMHNIDWHERIGARRKDLADYLGAMREDPVLGDLVDLGRLETMLANWSSSGPDSRDAMLGGWFAITSAVLAGQFVGAVSGRNDL